MEIIKFNNNKHLEILISWLKAHGAYLPTPDEMPEIGFLAVNEGVPVAAGFLRRVEGGFAQLDGLTTNPGAPGSLRHVGIDQVVETIIQTAKSLNLKALMAHTKDLDVLMRSTKHGFVKLPHTVIALDLTSPQDRSL